MHHRPTLLLLRTSGCGKQLVGDVAQPTATAMAATADLAHATREARHIFTGTDRSFAPLLPLRLHGSAAFPHGSLGFGIGFAYACMRPYIY